ncbi:unnamed protein product [Prorocentrum cordatum]|uniref:Uncharacterized protein n=1 Tax=Prorocentrum cordatum TaxID=2364126 RepID=A0ABN9UJY9_9DINO|nr:unnamed protein product [Polarella glacialis]
MGGRTSTRELQLGLSQQPPVAQPMALLPLAGSVPRAPPSHHAADAWAAPPAEPLRRMRRVPGLSAVAAQEARARLAPFLQVGRVRLGGIAPGTPPAGAPAPALLMLWPERRAAAGQATLGAHGPLAEASATRARDEATPVDAGGQGLNQDPRGHVQQRGSVRLDLAGDPGAAAPVLRRLAGWRGPPCRRRTTLSAAGCICLAPSFRQRT